MISFRKTIALGVLCLNLAYLPAKAETRIQSDIGYRKDIMMAMDWNLVRIAQMLRHQRPYNRDRLISEGQAIRVLSTMSWVAFVPGSDVGYTKAEPRIWQQPAQFQTKIRDFEQLAMQLDQATSQGQLANVARPLGAVAQSCRSCHHHFMK
jgi:cytochrome c556